MSAPSIAWGELLADARGWLGLEDGEPVPTDELLEQAKAVGYTEREARESLRETDVLEHAGNGLGAGIVLADDGATEDDSLEDGTPGLETRDTPSNTSKSEESHKKAESGTRWDDVDFSNTTAGTYPPELLEQEQWMGRAGKSGKQPFAPWADRDHPDADAEDDARWKWGLEENYVDGETVAIAEDDPRLEGRVFIQREDDPYAFVDGDDVRCPETGEVHPAFVAILEQLGLTYADVSTSGAGAHAYYKGELPIDGKGQATFEIDTEPWGANDSPPAVEIYANKHVNVATGEHVDGTPLEIREWDTDVLRSILQANGYQDEPEVHHDTDRDRDDLEDHTPDATGRDETTQDVRDVLKAVDRLRPSDLRLKARQTGEDSTGWTTWDPSYRSSESGSSLHYNGEGVFYDHREGEEFGILGLFAAEQDIITNPWDRLEGEDWWEAVNAARDSGAPIPKYIGAADTDDVDPLDLEVVLDPELAHTAAGDVSAEHFDDGMLETLEGISPTTDGERWMVDGREDAGAFDVVRAVAIAEGIVDPEEPMDGEQYTHAYDRARDAYGAPLPEYVDGTTATDRWHVIQGAVSQLTHWHLSSIRSRVTGLTEDDDTLAVIDPCWADSASGERVVAFRSGAFYDRDAERTIDPLRFVALENGLIDDPSETLSGAAFKSAYHLAREEYGAPLPEWNVGNPSHVAVLPPAEDLLGEFTTDGDRLDRTRKQVEQLYRDVAGDERTAHLLTPLPALGKTTSVAKNADEYPALYLAPRNELSGDMAQKADKYGRSWMYLPTFAEGETNDAAILEAAQYVREQGKDVLRDRDALADAVESPLFESDDTTEIDRDSCPTASGEHGEAWALAVHAARELGHTPQEIHNRDLELFGERLPCHAEDGEKCPYSLAWERATDPESPKDILIGHYVHAHVAGARTYYHKQDDRTELEPRTVVVDEFPEDAYAEEFGEDARDHATWLAGALRDVGDWHTLLEDAGDLWSDEWVRAWCHGDVASADDTTRDLLEVLDAAHDVARAIGEVQDVRETYAGTIAEHDLEDVLETVPEPGEWTVESGRNALSALRTALKDLDPSASTGSGIKRLGDETLEAIGTAVAALENSVASDDGEPLLETTEELLDEVPIATDGELRTLLEDAVDAYREGGGAPKLESARAALEGGRDGCRELAVASDDGYAHPRAHLLLYATIAQDTDRVSDVETPSFSFNETDGTTLKRVRVGDNTVLFDRNHHGALVHSPPELRDRAGSRNSFIGLDATGREELWRLAIGRNVKQVDPHETLDTRRRFLREVLNVQIVQTSRNINTYSGNPDGKNFDEDLELCKRVGEEYGAQQLRRDTLTSTTKPGVITTKKARRAMGDDLEEYAEAVDHYGNVTGSNAMGDLNVGIVLGTRHFGDAPVEKWAALAGEEVSRSGHGTTLDYGSDVANTYLKHMREDETMQAILRFGRDEEGAVVFAHTAALRDDLPVVADADVVRSFSPTIRDVAETLPEFRRGEFTVSDVAEHVDRSRRSIQRAMAELAELGYLEREDPGEGRANEYDVLEQPGRAEVSLPEVEGTDPDKARMDIQYTVTVGVRDGSGGDTRPTPGTRAIIPSPDGSNVGDRASTEAK